MSRSAVKTSSSPVSMFVDAAVLLLVCVVALSPLGDVFAGSRWVTTALIGAGLGAAVAALGLRFSWGPVAHVLALAAGFVAVGPAAAAPEQATASLVPSLSAERLLILGSFQSWRQILTLPTPMGVGRGELVAPFLIAMLLGLASALLLWRGRHPGMAWLPVVTASVVAAAFGGSVSELSIGRGVALVALLLVWLRWRTFRLSGAAWLRRVVMGGSVLALTASGAWAFASAAAPEYRDVLRDHVDPPLADLDFKSPLARYRDYYKSHEDDVLYEFSGLPGGEPLVRLASMDTYDGSVWNVTTIDQRTGSSDFRQAAFRGDGAAMTVTVKAADGPWVPTVGTAVGALADPVADAPARDLLLNPTTGGVVFDGGVRDGDVIQVEWEPRPERSDDLTRVPIATDVPLPPLDVPAIETLDTLTQRRIARAGVSSPYEKLEALEQMFRDDGFFNDGLTPRERGYSAAGHSARRLADLTADPSRMVGNDEQYAAALAYAAQRMGIPSRVVLGFEKVSSRGTVTGDDIAAWVEVPFEGRGWIAFDPTPPEDQKPPPLQDNPNPLPQPYVVQPPVLPQEPGDIQGVPPAGAGRDEGTDVLGFLRALLVWTVRAGLVAVALSPLWGVVLAKHMRRRRRRSAADPMNRLSGAWREVTDQARDLGARASSTATRLESGVELAARFPECGSLLLAATADQHVFGPGEPSDDEVRAYWADVDTALKRMRAATPWWQRMLAVLSPVSLPWGVLVRRIRDRGLRSGRAVAAQFQRLTSWFGHRASGLRGSRLRGGSDNV